jgi:hypothetical protein
MQSMAIKKGVRNKARPRPLRTLAKTGALRSRLEDLDDSRGEICAGRFSVICLVSLVMFLFSYVFTRKTGSLLSIYVNSKIQIFDVSNNASCLKFSSMKTLFKDCIGPCKSRLRRSAVWLLYVPATRSKECWR